jgi:hypothetical protein
VGPHKKPLQINFEGVFYVSGNLKKIICKKLAKKSDDKVKEFAKKRVKRGENNHKNLDQKKAQMSPK